MLAVAVVIVNWNTRDLTINALRSLYADLSTSGLTADVYVVDNASTDGSAESIRVLFPQVRLIVSAENRGFGGANNLAIQQILNAPDPPPAIYLLNSDTLTQAGATRALYDALLAHERAGLVGAGLSYEDGSFQHSTFTFPGLRQLWVEFFPTPGRLIEGKFNGRYPK
ncbi:MAG: glycosyltransferase, partial [Chloroflexota bacterium]